MDIQLSYIHALGACEWIASPCVASIRLQGAGIDEGSRVQPIRAEVGDNNCGLVDGVDCAPNPWHGVRQWPH